MASTIRASNAVGGSNTNCPARVDQLSCLVWTMGIQVGQNVQISGNTYVSRP